MKCVILWFCAVGLAATPGAAAEVKLGAEEQKAVSLLNQERKKARLPLLKPNAALCAAARKHAAAMAGRSQPKLSFDDKPLLEQLKEAGYNADISGSLVGAGTDTGAVVKAMLANKICRDQVFSPKMTEIGIGIAAGKGSVYYNVVVAQPK